ncbi:flagellin [Yoonia sp. 2307UL14-13]|uniref:flagellin n=1 Tax=Yoonia sp. 2307UL14-13 TaxID=3126506 RepID=UPI0030B52577
MPVTSLGDMSQHFSAARQTGVIKSDLADLAKSLSTRQVTDVTAALGGETTRLSGINHSLAQLDGYGQAGTETAQMLTGMQNILSQIDQIRGDSANNLLLVTQESSPAQVDEAGRAAADAFADMVRGINTRVADRALMGGAAVDTAPLANADAMFADLQTAIGGVTDAATIIGAVDTWFDDPAGGFATMGYQGDDGAPLSRRISENKTVTLDARADDPAIRDVLKAAALAAVADRATGIDQDTKATLLRTAGEQLFTSASGLVAVQSRLGYVEQQVDTGLAKNAAQKTALGIARNDLIQADPFEIATRLQDVQLQLETHFSVTARLSRLSILDFIR